jgi:hypothetical protein
MNPRHHVYKYASVKNMINKLSKREKGKNKREGCRFEYAGAWALVINEKTWQISAITSAAGHWMLRSSNSDFKTKISATRMAPAKR